VSGVPVEGDACSFTVAHGQSSAIGTVTIINWSTDFAGVTEAHIDFGPADGDWAMSAPVDLEQAGYRTLLLGMKPAREYGFRLVAAGASGTCTSADVAVTTGPAPTDIKLPVLTKVEEQAGGVQGFYLASPGIRTAEPRNLPGAYIFDTDGDLVWWTPESVEHISAAQMSWDGQAMWYVNANGGDLYRTTMDGLSTDAFDAGTAEHDLVPLPEGEVATFARNDDGTSVLIEVQDDGTFSEIVQLPDIYTTSTETYHPNALGYYERDDTFTISDLNLDGFVKITRLGELIWQLGGENPLGDSFDLVGTDHAGGHGHDLGPNGQFLFFDNAFDSAISLVVELLLDEDAWTADKTWEYSLGSQSMYLGAAQRLPNGNTSVVHSMAGKVLEVTPAGELVQSFDNSVSFQEDGLNAAVFGYVRFRPTLYGPPQSYWPD